MEVKLIQCLAKWYQDRYDCSRTHALLLQTVIQCYILCIKLLFRVTFLHVLMLHLHILLLHLHIIMLHLHVLMLHLHIHDAPFGYP